MPSVTNLFVIVALLLSFHVSSQAREIRVATFNVKSGVGAVGSPEYNAVRDILTRIVAYQELRTSDQPNWNALALELGYEHQVMGDVTSLSGSLHVGYFSRFPITSTFNVFSPQSCTPPTTVNDITRPPLRAVIDVPGAEKPLVLWNLHQKASSGIANEFRRAVEAVRVNDDIDNYLLTNPSHTEYIVHRNSLNWYYLDVNRPFAWHKFLAKLFEIVLNNRRCHRMLIFFHIG